MRVGRLLSKSLFVRLMASFLLVIVIVTIFYFASFSVYLGNLQDEIVNNARERLSITATRFDNEFKRVLESLYRLSTDEWFRPALGSRNLTYFQMEQIRQLMVRQTVQDECISAVFLVSERSGMIVSSDGTFDREKFFDKFYHNPRYTLQFWQGERSGKFVSKIYSSATYADLSNAGTADQFLLPVAYKDNFDSGYILVALVDIGRIAGGIDKAFLGNFHVYNGDGALLYPAGPAWTDDDPAPAAAGGARRVDGGFVLSRASAVGGIAYARFLPGSDVRAALFRVYATMVVVLAVALAISVLLSFIIARRTNAQAKRIVEIMGGAGGPPELTDLQNIRNNIQSIVAQNDRYSSEIRTKDLILEDFFFRTRIRDVHARFDGLYGGSSTIQGDYILVCFQLHRGDLLPDGTSPEMSRCAFGVMEQLDRLLSRHYARHISFQSESDQIVTLLGVEPAAGSGGAADAVAEALADLSEAEPLVFFTVAVSGVNNDVLSLDAVYREMTSLLRHRKLLDRNQILSQGDGNRQAARFFFSLDQAERLMGLVRNAQQNQCLQFLDDILDDNAARGTDNFQMTLLCDEIVNCGVKTLTEYQKALPPGFRQDEVYARLEKCWDLDQFRGVCKQFMLAALGCVSKFEKNKEYIVDYIKEYVSGHYAEDIYLDLFADKLNLTKAYISLHFKQKTGMNFSDWLNDFRMKKAVELLDSTEMRIEEIGKRIGQGANTFYRTFRKHCGMTPNEYRQARHMDQTRRP